MKPFPARKPVFVDSSGHRHRKIRRLGLVVAIPVVGYLVLLASSVLGGPQVDTPLIPLPEAAKQQPAPRVKTTQQPVQTPEPGDPTSDSTVRPVTGESITPSPTGLPSSGPTPSATATPTAGSSATQTTSPTTRPTVAPGGTPANSKPTQPPGRTNSPGKP